MVDNNYKAPVQAAAYASKVTNYADPLRFDAATDIPHPSSSDGFPVDDSPDRAGSSSISIEQSAIERLKSRHLGSISFLSWRTFLSGLFQTSSVLRHVSRIEMLFPSFTNSRGCVDFFPLSTKQSSCLWRLARPPPKGLNVRISVP